jgi:hypothetical protein
MLDQAQKSVTKFTWFFDNYGNLIGSAIIPTTYTYGVIKNIQWINPVGSTGYAQATLALTDGTEVTKVVTTMNGIGLVYAANANQVGQAQGSNVYGVSTSIADNASAYNGLALYQIAENNAGVSLVMVGGMANVTASGRLTSATIVNKQAAIAGTASVGTASSIVADDSTVFMLASNAGTTTFATSIVTGINSVPSYSNNHVAGLDYVDTDNDGRAEYVYVIGTPDTATSQGVFYLTTTSYSQVLMADGVTVDYYVLTVYVNGSTTLGTIYIDNDAQGTGTALVNTIITAGANKLWNTTTVGGYVTAATQVVATAAQVASAGAYNGSYDIYAQTNNGTTAYYDAGVLSYNNVNYYVTDATKVLGTLTAGTTYSAEDIYVVYNSVAAQNYATEIYVSKTDAAQNSGSAAPVTADTLVLTQNGALVQAYYTNNSGATRNNVKIVYQYRIAGSGNAYSTVTGAWTGNVNSAVNWKSAGNALTLPTSQITNTYEVIATVYAGSTVVATASGTFIA